MTFTEKKGLDLQVTLFDFKLNNIIIFIYEKIEFIYCSFFICILMHL